MYALRSREVRGAAEGIGSNPNLRSSCSFGVSAFRRLPCLFVVSFEFLRFVSETGPVQCEILVKGLLRVHVLV